MNADKLAGLLRRAIPCLREAGEQYLDDGSNEPLELARDADEALAEHDAQPAQADKTLIVNMDQAAAWRAVADALTEVAPGWLRGDGTGMECAVATIKRLAKPAQAVQPKIGDFDARDSFSMQTDATTLQRNAAQPVGVPDGFLQHIASVCRGTIENCEPADDEERERWGGQCLNELGEIADQIDDMLTAPQPPAQPSADAEDRAVEAFDDVYDGVSHNKREAIRDAIIAARAAEGDE